MTEFDGTYVPNLMQVDSPFFGKATAKASIEVIDELAAEPLLEPDYEALGYPETTVHHPGRYTLDVWADRLLWAMADAGLDWRPTVDNE